VPVCCGMLVCGRDGAHQTPQRTTARNIGLPVANKQVDQSQFTMERRKPLSLILRTCRTSAWSKHMTRRRSPVTVPTTCTLLPRPRSASCIGLLPPHEPHDASQKGRGVVWRSCQTWTPADSPGTLRDHVQPLQRSDIPGGDARGVRRHGGLHWEPAVTCCYSNRRWLMTKEEINAELSSTLAISSWPDDVMGGEAGGALG